jgi:two-component system CheB/CheR fusion protein
MKKNTKPDQADPKPAKAAAPGSPPAASRSRQGAGSTPLLIVGVGASAGGLEALEQFFRNVPAGCGLAFVVVQHLDPTQKGVMVELLQRLTPMPVAQAKERLKIHPDRVYVIPPNKNLSVLNGSLHLFAPEAPRGLRLPIDFFFRSLAEDQRENAVGVILSGMGSDGMLGLRAIKENAGGGFVQEPGSAKFDGMPRSAVDAGLADIVAPAEELPGKILAFLRRPRLVARPNLLLGATAQSTLEKIFIHLRSKTGQDFSQYKKSTIHRRIERRMGLHQIDKLSVYARYLQENPQEAELLFKELLIGVTSFFRDPAVWDQLKQRLTASLAARPKDSTYRAWTPGCSTGEEAYSLSMIFQEALEEAKVPGKYTLHVFATDLDADAIEKARAGLYPANIEADVSPERLRRFFVKEEQGYRVGKVIRDSVIFAPQNVIMEPPFTRLDILVCRNLLIYLEPGLQKKLLPLFHYALKPGGILCLGTSETIGSFTDLFAPLDSKARLYRRLVPTGRAELVEFPSAYSAPPGGAASANPEGRTKAPVPNMQALADQLLLQRFSPAAVLTNAQGDILYFSGRTGKYLEPASGKASLNIFSMARDGLRLELSSAFHRALRQPEAITMKGLAVGTNGGTQTVDVTVQMLQERSSLQGMVMVVFKDVDPLPSSPPPGRKASAKMVQSELERMKTEMQLSREELQLTREEMQTSQEELKSTNEELQSTNEELQSTNEELTTSKEEMQSMNEELQTVNLEMQAKLDELSRSNNDLKNLLNSTDIATLFLDEGLNVRRFTPQTATIIKLIPGDVGRPITDIVTDLDYPGMAKDAQDVLENLGFVEKPVTTRDGRWFLVRIKPYRTVDNRIDGVVITFADISAAKQLEASLRENEQRMKALFQGMPLAFALLEAVFGDPAQLADARFLFANAAFADLAGKGLPTIQGRTLLDLWPEFAPDWLRAFGPTVARGAVQRLELQMGQGGRRCRCTVYRPEGSLHRFCIMLEGVQDN